MFSLVIEGLTIKNSFVFSSYSSAISLTVCPDITLCVPCVSVVPNNKYFDNSLESVNIVSSVLM